MKRLLIAAVAFTCFAIASDAADWMQFRGPTGSGRSEEKGLPEKWTETENVVWKTALPGLGSSCPITVGDAIYLTCYSGYAETVEKPGDQKNLMRHLVCLDRAKGTIRWKKDVPPQLPESEYSGGNNSWHGYASSTPTSDGKNIFCFFGKSGVWCFDLKGEKVWSTSVGTQATGWGSATSPVLYKDLVIVNAGVESGNLVALNKVTGKEVWKTPGTSSAWSSPILVNLPSGKSEIVMNLPQKKGEGRIAAFNPEDGKEIWTCKGIPDGYVCPSVIHHEGVIYAIGGRKNTSVAVKAGGSGEVKPLWTTGNGSNVTSPVYHDKHIYWMHERSGTAYCVEAATGKQVYAEKVPGVGTTYSSGLYADGRIYYVTQKGGTIVLAASPEFKLLATNKLEDTSRTNASPVPDNGKLLIRTDKNLYCIGKK